MEPDPQPSLAQLVTRAAQGDPAAEAELCVRFAPAVRAFARRRLRDRDAVDEFTQEVFLTCPWLTQLDDYVTGHMSDEEALTWEDGLFVSAGDGTDDGDAAYFDELHRTFPFAGRFGIIAESVNGALLDRLEREGHRIHRVEFELGKDTVLHPWREDIDLVVCHLHIDARDYDTVDVEVIRERDQFHLKTFKDSGFDPVDGNVYALCEEPLARISMLSLPEHIVCRVVGYRDGARLELGDFRAVPAPA
ncbi:MAG TPA: hypothetical protein VLC09_06115 [Polyangiaceae bacterium]|nr:hypothetical protein [Polyangiaceae bacterium]